MKEAKVWLFKVWKLTWNKSFTFFFFLIIKRSTWIYLRRTLRLKNYRGQNTIGIRKDYNWKFGRKTNEDTWKYANKGVGLFLSLTVFPLGLGFLLYIDLKVKSSLDTYAENIFSWKIISRKCLFFQEFVCDPKNIFMYLALQKNYLLRILLNIYQIQNTTKKYLHVFLAVGW